MKFKKLSSAGLVGEVTKHYIGGTNTNKAYDPFFLEDLLKATNGEYKLIIRDGPYVTAENIYNLFDVEVDVNSLGSQTVTYKLELFDKNSDFKTERIFNISNIEMNTLQKDDPKYYIYCDGSDEISFGFIFLRNR